jgi:hypothetical protein
LRPLKKATVYNAKKPGLPAFKAHDVAVESA